MTSSKTTFQLSIAGGIGGIVEAVAVQPLDMVKTRFQLNEKANTSVYSALKDIVREGGFLRFYRGILPEIVGMVPKSSLMYMSYEVSKRYLTKLNHGHCNSKVAFAAGFISGYPEAISVTPFQVLKVRLQAKEHLGRYKNTFDCLGKVMRSEGPKALTVGFGPTCWRNCVWNSVYFGLLHKIRSQMWKSQYKSVETVQTLFAGFIAGLVATTFNAPFDVIKSRFQSELREENKRPKYRYTLQSLYTVFKEEGAAAMYKGYAPKAIRMALGGAVGMAAFEWTCLLLP